MPKAKPFTKDQILNAMAKTKSVKATARYLNCSYQHIKRWMKEFKDEETGLTLFELHKNQCGKGIPKFLSHSPFRKKEPAILDVIEGRIDASHFNPDKLKYRMIEGGYLKEECGSCGFHESRVLDSKLPLLMHFKDGNKQHYGLDNVHMLCYNCYFLFVANIFTDKDIEAIEDHKPISKTTEAVNWELDDYHMKRLKDIGLYKEDEDDDPYSLVSRK